MVEPPAFLYSLHPPAVHIDATIQCARPISTQDSSMDQSPVIDQVLFPNMAVIVLLSFQLDENKLSSPAWGGIVIIQIDFWQVYIL